MFSNSAAAAETRPQQVRGDLVLELLDAVDRHHRHPHAVPPDQLRIGVHVHHLEEERGGGTLGPEHRLGGLAEVAPAPGVEGDAAAGPGGGGAAPPWRAAPAAPPGVARGAEARRKPAYITVAPSASPAASLSLALRKANTPPAAASSTPAAISRLPSNLGRRSRRPRMASPLAPAPPTTTSVPTTLPATARARAPTGRISEPSGTARPARSAAPTSTRVIATVLARLNRIS